MLRGLLGRKSSHRINLVPLSKREPDSTFVWWIVIVAGFLGLAFVSSRRALGADPEVAIESQTTDVVLAKAAKPAKKPSKPHAPNAVLDPYGNVVDMAEDGAKLKGDADDDFAVVSNKIKRESQVSGQSDDAIVEAELEKIKTAEEIKRKEEERLEKIAERQRQANARKQYAEDRDTERKLRKEVQDEDDIGGISDEEARWQGLE